MNLHKKSILRYTAILAALAAISSSFAGTELILGTPFGDHMVLQREKPIPVWGWAPPATEITVYLAGRTDTAKSDAEGAWSVTLPALPAGGPHDMLVAGPTEVRITDILVGEVWVCSGQSNMAMALSETDQAAEDIAAADFPKMRLLKLPARRSGLPERVPPKPSPGWIACSPATAKSFNATAYFFGREIHRETGVPIGLIAAAAGSTQIEPWTPREGLALAPSFEKWHTTAMKVDAKYQESLVELSNAPTGPTVPAPVQPYLSRQDPQRKPIGDVFRIECLPRGIAFQSPRASSSPSGKLVDGGLTLHPISRRSISEFRLMEETKTRRERSRLPDGPPA